MNITDLTPQQLRRAASIKERLDGLNRDLHPTRWIVIEWSGVGKEAHHERGGTDRNSPNEKGT